MTAAVVNADVEFGIILHFEDVEGQLNRFFNWIGKAVFFVGNEMTFVKPIGFKTNDFVFTNVFTEYFLAGVNFSIGAFEENDGNFLAGDVFLNQDRLVIGGDKKIKPFSKFFFGIADGRVVNFNTAMDFIEFGNQGIVKIGVDDIVNVCDQLIFGSSNAVLIKKVFSKKLVGIDGFTHDAGTGVGEIEQFKGSGNRGGKIFFAIDGIDEVDDKMGREFFDVLGKIGVTREKTNFIMKIPKDLADQLSTGINFSFSEILLVGGEVLPFGVGIEDSNFQGQPARVISIFFHG